MPLTESINQLLGFLSRARRILVRVFFLWLGAFVILAALPVFKPSLFSHLFDPYWVDNSVSVHVLRSLEAHLLPGGETLIASGPFDTFTTVMLVGAGLALLVAVPYATWLLARWASPGLEPSERAVARTLGGMAIGLFGLGIAFGLFVLPSLYDFALNIQVAAGVAPVVTLDGFIGTTGIFTLGLGLGFEIPTLAYGLGSLGILKSRMIRAQMANAFLACVIAAFIISPGVGAGLIEIPIAFLLFGLYVASFYIVRRIERKREASPSRSEVTTAAD